MHTSEGATRVPLGSLRSERNAGSFGATHALSCPCTAGWMEQELDCIFSLLGALAAHYLLDHITRFGFGMLAPPWS